MGKREKAVFLEEAEGKRASSKVSLSKMILRMVGILLGSCGGHYRKRLFVRIYQETGRGIHKVRHRILCGADGTTFGDINDYLGELVFQDKDVAATRYTSDKHPVHSVCAENK